MNFEEHAAKPLLTAAGIATPRGVLAERPDEAARAASELGAVVVKAQVPTGKRGKAGGIGLADSPAEAEARAQAIIGLEIAGHRVEKVLVEERCGIAREFYAAVINDPASKSPLVMFSTEGGMDVEEIAAGAPGKLRTAPVDIRQGFDQVAARSLVKGLGLGEAADKVAKALARLYAAYRSYDAELIEINPLALTDEGEVVALDCKFVMDDSGVKRQAEVAAAGTPEKLTRLESRGQELVIKYIELDGDVGVLANGAGLTMTTMDVVRHHGGRPANFCEIGGEAYTKAKAALELVLSKPGIRSLVVNFCGAFARCDVMMEGFLGAWEELRPEIPLAFSIAGTGDEEAIAMLDERLGIAPHPDIDAACRAAVQADRATGDGQ